MEKSDFILTPEELYLRQSGECFLELVLEEDGKTLHLYCTDGDECARTDYLENPTKECSVCLTKKLLAFAAELLERNNEDTRDRDTE